MIYELNGIIEGIICYGEVNEAEILRLKNWMDDFGDNIRGDRSGEKLCKVIDDILEDGVVTEEKQDELLELLNIRISKVRLENKLAYLCKLVKEKKNIGIDLIDILDNESAIQEIHSRAESKLMQSISSYSGDCRNQEIIVISLALIAMLGYDGNYYDSVRETYKKLYRDYSEQKIEGKIRSILNEYKKQSESGSRKRIINVALENAIVPQAFLSGFFEFIFDIYKLDFEYDLPKEPYEDFEFVFEGLRNNMLSDGDDIFINVTRKTYKLIASTKQLISREDGLDAVIKLSIKIIELIDKRFWGKELKISNPYLKAGYEGWEKTFRETTRSENERKRSNQELRSRWEPKFEMFNNSVYLNPPNHRVKAKYGYRDVAVVVLNDGEEIYRNNQCDIREIIGGYRVNTEKFELDKPLGKLVYRLVAGDEIIYDSKDKLYRNGIVFNNNGQEISNNTDFEGTVHIAYKTGEANIDNIITKENYCIGYKLVRMGDAIEIGHDVFNFSAMAKPGIFGKLHPNCYVQQEGGEELIQVYRDECVVVFEADKVSNKFEISVNGQSKKLSEMQYKYTAKAFTTKYVVELELQKSGVYEIEINQLVLGRKKRILQERLVYDPDLRFTKEQIDNVSFRVQVTSRLLQHNINSEISISEFAPDFIQFEDADKKYNYFIPFNFGFYKLSEHKWRSLTEDLWIDDINDKSILDLYDVQCDGLVVYNESGEIIEDDIKLQDMGYHKQIPIYFLTSYKNENRFVTLEFTVEEKVKYRLSCYNKCVIDEESTEIQFYENPKRVEITPIYHGKNNVYYELFNPTGEKIFKSKLLSSGQTSTLKLKNFKSFKEYKIRFHEETKLLQLRKNTLLMEVSKIFYAKEDFIGRAFKIDEIYFNRIIHGEIEEKQWFFNKVYVKLTDIIDDDKGIFEGQIYIKANGRDFFLFNINPVEVEVCTDVIDGTMDVYITNQGDGLLFEPERGKILNTMEHPYAPDILLYTINLKG